MTRYCLLEHDFKLTLTSVETTCKTSYYWSTGLTGDVCITCKISFGPSGRAGEVGESGEVGLTGKYTKKHQKEEKQSQSKLNVLRK